MIHPLLAVVTAFLFALPACAQEKGKTAASPSKNQNMKPVAETNAKMKVEIWSDIVCPFCYIGKKNFEKALSGFAGAEEIEVVWKSYQLSPGLVTDTTVSVDQYLARHKGISVEEAHELNTYVTGMAAGAGLTYRLDKAVMANSLRAHCFLHLARSYGRQQEAAEKLFSAYFTEGKNIDDISTLTEIGIAAGLDGALVTKTLNEGGFTDAVRMDLLEADKIGVQGVPYFRFNGRRTVSGAMEPKVFREALEKSYEEWKNNR